jgi:hypothetical protein
MACAARLTPFPAAQVLNAEEKKAMSLYSYEEKVSAVQCSAPFSALSLQSFLQMTSYPLPIHTDPFL